MSLGDFRSIFLPYCLRKLSDGRYVVLNRRYKPVGLKAKDHVEYEEYSVNLKGIGPATAAKLSWEADPNTDNIYL